MHDLNIETRGIHVPFSDQLRAHVETRFGYALGRFRDRIERVIVRLTDINGPRGGAADKVCLVKVHLLSGIRLIARGASHDPYAAITHAADCTDRVLRRLMSRRGRSPRQPRHVLKLDQF